MSRCWLEQTLNSFGCLELSQAMEEGEVMVILEMQP